MLQAVIFKTTKGSLHNSFMYMEGALAERLQQMVYANESSYCLQVACGLAVGFQIISLYYGRYHCFPWMLSVVKIEKKGAKLHLEVREGFELRWEVNKEWRLGRVQRGGYGNLSRGNGIGKDIEAWANKLGEWEYQKFSISRGPGRGLGQNLKQEPS